MVKVHPTFRKTGISSDIHQWHFIILTWQLKWQQICK